MRLAHPVRAVPVADLLPAAESVLGSGVLVQTGVAHLPTRPAVLVAVVLPHEFTSLRVELSPADSLGRAVSVEDRSARSKVDQDMGCTRAPSTPSSQADASPLLDLTGRRAYPDRLCVLGRACWAVRTRSHAVDYRPSVVLAGTHDSWEEVNPWHSSTQPREAPSRPLSPAPPSMPSTCGANQASNPHFGATQSDS